MDNNIVTEEIAQKVLKIVSKGLSKGLGKQKKGKMCIEAAVCFAYGLPHGDNPPCVGIGAIRAHKIRLNDANWSSPKARAEGMKSIAIAQLGSVNLNQTEFSKRIVLKTIQTIIADLSVIYLPEVEQKLREVTDLSIAKGLCKELSNAAAAADAFYAADAASAAAATHVAAVYNAIAAGDKTNADAIFTIAVNNCLEILKEMNSPGCEFLYLLDKPKT